MPSLPWRDALWLPVRELAVGRLVVLPVRPWVPAVGLVLVLGRADALAEPVLPVVLLDMLPAVGRLVVLPLNEPLPLLLLRPSLVG